MTPRRFIRTLSIFLLVLTMVNKLRAQSGTSSALAGSVLDQSGAVVAGAEVKADEVNTGSVRAIQTNPEGRFLFSQVNPGTYLIEVHAAGFDAGRSQPTEVSVGQTATVSFTLSPTATSQTINVTAQSGLMIIRTPRQPSMLRPSRAFLTLART